MGESYWQRPRRFGRRRFLASAGLAATGAASLALVGCGDDDDDGDGQTATSTGPPTQPQPTPQASPSPEPSPAGGATDGVLYNNRTLSLVDAFDANRSQVDPMHFIFSATMSRLVEYDDPEGLNLVGDLAVAPPRQPDPLTMVFDLKPGITWHDKPPVNGREFAADDVVYFVERQKNGVDNPDLGLFFFRRDALSVIESVEAVDDRTIAFHLARPDSTLLETLAGLSSFVVAREAAEAFSDEQWKEGDPATLIGTGPFILDDFALADRARFSRNPRYFDQAAPVADGAWFYDVTDGRAAFETKQIDWWQPPPQSQTDAARVQQAHPEVVLQDFGLGNPVIGSFATINPPWNDVRLVDAISRATDRRQLVDQLHGGRGLPDPLVSWTSTEWALPQDELETLPGYLADKDEDYTQARLLWEAASGPAQLTMSFPDAYVNAFPAAPELVISQLASVLGVQMSSRVVTYQEIVGGIFGKTLSVWCGWGSSYPPDPSGTLYRLFHSSASNYGINQPGGLVVEGLDEKLERLVQEYDRQERIEQVLDLQREAPRYGGFGLMMYHNQIGQILNWPYYKGLRPSSFYFGHDMKNHWLDPDDPSFQGRP
jgi:ABC-type transport system substrate-binding protein